MPRTPVTMTARGIPDAARNGIIAAAPISEIFSRLYHRMLDLLRTSYQPIWSSRRSMIGSGTEFGIVAFMGAHSKTYQYEKKVSITPKNAPVNNLSLTRKTPGGRQSRAMDDSRGHSRCGERTIHSCFPSGLHSTARHSSDRYRFQRQPH